MLQLWVYFTNFLSVNTLKADVPSRKELEKVQEILEDKLNTMDRSTPNHGYDNALTSIEKQRRGWEEAREKAEEMAQIFDSLIITSKYFLSIQISIIL